MCTCIKRLEKKLTKKFHEENPNSEQWESVQLNNKALMIENLSTQMHGSAEVIFLNEKGKKKTWKKNLIFSFCPFCGFKY